MNAVRSTLALLACAAVATPAAALNIVLTDTTPGGMAAAPLAALQAAAQVWQSAIRTPVTVYLQVDYQVASTTRALGWSDATFSEAPYAQVRGALLAGATTAADRSSAASLAAGSGFNFWASNLDGSTRFDNDSNPCPAAGPSVPCAYNNTNVLMTTANAKALGFDPGTSAARPDAVVHFNAAYASVLDFNRADGIAPGQRDFTALAAHEIGHALGFVSGVDSADGCNPVSNCAPDVDNAFGLERYAVYTPLDLFRYSAAGVRDLRVGVAAYLSLDGGAGNVQYLSTGAFHGDGAQASHFKAGRPDLLSPLFAAGIEVNPSAADLTAFDVMGWTLASASAVPEAATLPLWLAGLGLLWRMHRPAARSRRGASA